VTAPAHTQPQAVRWDIPPNANRARRPRHCVTANELLHAVLPHHPRLHRDGLRRHTVGVAASCSALSDLGESFARRGTSVTQASVSNACSDEPSLGLPGGRRRIPERSRGRRGAWSLKDCLHGPGAKGHAAGPALLQWATAVRAAHVRAVGAGPVRGDSPMGARARSRRVPRRLEGLAHRPVP
jgi:hypothetical protein